MVCVHVNGVNSSIRWYVHWLKQIDQNLRYAQKRNCAIEIFRLKNLHIIYRLSPLQSNCKNFQSVKIDAVGNKMQKPICRYMCII